MKLYTSQNHLEKNHFNQASKIFHYKFSNTYYILSQYTLKSMQLLCHCVYVSLLVYWIAYKLAYFTVLQSAFSPRSTNFPADFFKHVSRFCVSISWLQIDLINEVATKTFSYLYINLGWKIYCNEWNNFFISLIIIGFP